MSFIIPNLISAKVKALPKSIRIKLRKVLREYTTNSENNSRHFSEVPITEIIKGFKKAGVLIIQEDGEEWNGMLVGREGSANLFMKLIETDDLINSMLVLSWYKQGSKYEVNAYVS